MGENKNRKTAFIEGTRQCNMMFTNVGMSMDDGCTEVHSTNSKPKRKRDRSRDSDTDNDNIKTGLRCYDNVKWIKFTRNRFQQSES
jgi:hypothetical protein